MGKTTTTTRSVEAWLVGATKGWWWVVLFCEHQSPPPACAIRFDEEINSHALPFKDSTHTALRLLFRWAALRLKISSSSIASSRASAATCSTATCNLPGPVRDDMTPSSLLWQWCVAFYRGQRRQRYKMLEHLLAVAGGERICNISSFDFKNTP